MNKRSILAKRLASYSAFGAVVLAINETDGQIVYHDVNPDFIIPEGTYGTYQLDMNGDAADDFGFYAIGGGYTPVYFYSAGNQPYITDEAVEDDPFLAGQLISSGNSWDNSFLMGHYSSTGGGGGWWFNETDKYLGLRFRLGSNYYYGWARLDILANGNSFVIKDYAYESQPNTPIVAGETGCSITPVISQVADESLVSSAPNGNQWYWNGSPIPGEINDTLAVLQTGLYSTHVTDSAGCISSSLSFNFITCDSVDIHAHMNADTSGNNICSGSFATFHFDGNMYSNFQLQWYKNGQPVSGATSNWYYPGQITSSSSFFATLHNDITGCTDSTEIFSLNVLPVPPIPIVSQSYDTLSTENNHPGYQWKKGYNPISGATTYYYVFSINDLYSVSVMDSNGCSTSSNQIYYDKCSYFNSTITVDGYAYICDNDSVLLTVDSQTNLTYNWKQDNIPVNEFDSATFANQAGIYSCSVHDTVRGCTWNPHVTISTSEPTQPQIFISGDSLISSPSYYYQWFLNGNEIPGATSQSFHPDTTGYYTVKITNLYGCTNISVAVYHEEIPTAITEINGNELQHEKWLGGSFRVYNVFGEEIFSAIVESVPLQLNLERFPAGIYYIAIRKENAYSVFKVINVK